MNTQLTIASQFEDLSSEVLKDGSEVDGCTGTNSLGVVSFPEHSVDTADGELEAGLAGPRLLGLCGVTGSSSFSTFSRHGDRLDGMGWGMWNGRWDDGI